MPRVTDEDEAADAAHLPHAASEDEPRAKRVDNHRAKTIAKSLEDLRRINAARIELYRALARERMN